MQRRQPRRRHPLFRECAQCARFTDNHSPYARLLAAAFGLGSNATADDKDDNQYAPMHSTVRAGLAAHSPSDLRRALWALFALCAGCATQPAPPPAPAVVPAAPSAVLPASPADGRTAPRPAPAPAPSPLAAEQRWLDDWFRGTPVSIALQAPATLAVDVPPAHSFEPGSAAPKAALVAVLDRVAESLRRQATTRITIATASDVGGAPALAQTRAQRVRDHLVSRHIAATRVSTLPGSTAGAGVQLRIVLPPAPIARLDDASLPVPASGVKPVSTARPTSAAPAR